MIGIIWDRRWYKEHWGCGPIQAIRDINATERRLEKEGVSTPSTIYGRVTTNPKYDVVVLCLLSFALGFVGGQLI